MANCDSFIERCLRGEAVPEDIDTYVDQWHAGRLAEGVGLRDRLGLSADEYVRWMRDAGSIPSIIAERRSALTGERLPLRSFPSIDQLRHVVASVRHHAEHIGQGADGQPQYDASRVKLVLTFRGTTKLHGTNAGAAFNLVSGEVYAQSRERIMTLEKDNFGFAAWLLAADTAQDRSQLRDAVLAAAGALDQPIVAARVFGEWCGRKVNAKTAIGQLPQRWVIFTTLVTLADGTERWFSAEHIAKAWPGERRSGSLIHFISEYPQWHIQIDFNNPEAALDELERLTLEVESECPVAKVLGLSGMGEGIVWTYHDAMHGRLWFKTKGLKHKGTKNARLVQIEPEVLASLEAFAEAVVTESRLEQGFELLRSQHGTVNDRHIGDFLKWFGQDVLKEESDTLEASGLERKQVMGRVSERAKAWLMPRLARV